MIPEAWREMVPGVPLPSPEAMATPTEEAREAWKAFLGQSGQLSIANGRLADAIWIMDKCEANANKARPRRKVLGVL